MEVPVPAGRHVVRARIDWTGSEDLIVDVGVGLSTRVRVEASGTAWEALWQVAGRSRWLVLSVES
jgi:hypothetical protein